MPKMRRLLCHRMPALNNISRLPWIKGNRLKLERVAPEIAVGPVISGTGAVGSTISFVSSSWSGNPVPTITRQWFADATPISGATGTSYTPVAGDSGKTITMHETASNPFGTETAISNGILVA